MAWQWDESFRCAGWLHHSLRSEQCCSISLSHEEFSILSRAGCGGGEGQPGNIPISKTFPPRLVSSPNGASHVGHSWPSNSRMNS